MMMNMNGLVWSVSATFVVSVFLSIIFEEKWLFGFTGIKMSFILVH